MVATPIIIDIEASGFGRGSYPIEIGYVDRLGKPWCRLITPSDEWVHWNNVAEELHHIKRETLFAYGKSIDYVANHLNSVFLNKTIYSDGWLQDYTWLSKLFEKANVSPHFKLEDLRTILTPHQAAIWHRTKQSILDELKISRHRASADAKVLQLTWQKSRKQEVTAYV